MITTKPRTIRLPALTAVSFAALLIGLSSRAQARDWPAGKVIERVACLKDASQSYALYLPSSYTPQRQWPIIYGFDPGARGPRPVEGFKDAAEKYGYIVVGSNNSRNGANVPLNEIIGALLDDTQSRLSIDAKRVYTAGFSGGARVAAAIAQSPSGQIAGVILCGAGFSSRQAPAKPLPFVVFGLAGSEDFNWTEMKQLHRALDAIGSANRFVTFDGDHAWPPSDFCATAVEWMELQAMKSGRRQRDQKLIAELFDRAVGQLRADESANRVYETFLKCDAVAKDFQGLRDTAEFAAKADQLKSSREVKDRLKRERSAEQTQQRREREFFTLRERLKAAEDRSLAMMEMRGLIADLRKKAAISAPDNDRVVARRLLAQFTVAMFEEATQYRFLKKYADAAVSLTIAAEIGPENPNVFYHLARTYALGGDRKQAVAALKHAVEKGLTGAGEINANPDLESIRGEAEYRQLIEALGRKARN